MTEIKIEIVGPVETSTRSYNGVATTYFTQLAYLHRPSEVYPEKVNFSLESAADGLPLGYYEIDFDKSLQVGQWNALGFSRYLKLIPTKSNTQVGPSANQPAQKTA